MNAYTGTGRPMWRWRGWALFALLAGALAMAALGGCTSLGYYAQSVSGHLGVLERARPVPDVLADSTTPAALRERLRLSQRLRDFAVSELKLPDNASYRRYADLQRTAAVWNVVAAPELGLQLKTWCFFVAGCVGYRGYYDRTQADALAAELHAQGLEVQVYGVPAYSTLGKLPVGGYFADPLLNTFIHSAEPDLARLIFHELAHQVAYAEGDTEFNEAFATAVERLGRARWLAQSSPEQRAAAALMESRREDFRALTLKARAELDAIYRSDRSEADKRTAKAEAMARLRAEHAALKAGPWQGFAGFDPWLAQANNASLAVLSAYQGLAPAFERLFDAQGRDFDRFYGEVRRLATLPREARRATLAAL